MDENLKKRVDHLEILFKQHTHIGSDMSQKLNIKIVYGGFVDLNASAATLPGSWMVSVSAGNVYTITHNLGVTNYTVIAIAINSNSITSFHPFLVRNASTFTVEFDNASAVAGKTDWTFSLILI